MYGMGIQMVMRPMLFLSDTMLPSSEEQMSEEMFEAIVEQQKANFDIASMMKAQPMMKEVLMELVEELVQLMDALKIV
jgi:hypothetical protein